MRQKFIDAVESGNLISVRYSLTNELLLDPRGKSYREMKAFAEERLDGLYEPLNGELPQKPVGEFTEAELMELKNDLDANFSRERLALYEKVVGVVLRDKADQMAQESNSHEERKAPRQRRKSEKNNDMAITAVAAGTTGIAAFGLAKAFALSTGTAAVIGVAATMAGGAVAKYIKDNDREDEEI